MIPIGELCLFNLGGGTERPFLVVSHKGEDHRGDLFLDFEADSGSEWVRHNVFTKPWEQHRTLWVKAAKEGSGTGEIHRRAAQTKPLFARAR